MEVINQEVIAGTRARLMDKRVSVSELRFIWETRDRKIWAASPDLYRLLAERTLKAGEPFWTHDITTQGLEFAEDDTLRLKHLRALSLAQSGSSEAANRLMIDLLSEGNEDMETLSLLARTHKDLWKQVNEDAEKKGHLELSYHNYLKAFNNTKDYYPGINAATLAVFLGNIDEAKTLAKEVYAICRECEATDKSHWLKATIAEASLIRGDLSTAKDFYMQACYIADKDQNAICTIRKQARLLSQYLIRDKNALDDCFTIGRVGVFTGHMIDQPGRPIPRFPGEYEEQVKAEIAKVIAKHNITFGYSAAACGGDILFLEAIQERGGEHHIVLPFADQSFWDISVDILPGSDWAERYDRLMTDAASVTFVSQDSYSGGAVDFDFANQVMIGVSNLKRSILDTDLQPVAIWDGKPGDGKGGTADAINLWRDNGFEVDVIKLNDVIPNLPVYDSKPAEVKEVTQEGEDQKSPISQEIKTIFFADIVGFSKLKEMDIPVYYQHFLERTADLIEKFPNPPIIKNTWGDAVYLVFDDASQAGHFALQLRDMICGTNWMELGLSRELNVRIGIHAGPVTRFRDPVTKLPSCTGYHVSRAARIEPITAEGQIYVSEAFAALSSVNEDSHFVCEYVGEVQLAKKYGAYRVYLLRDED